MKLNNNKKQAGLTLIEITLVIAVLLGLISVLFIGVSAYREGSNRAKCILQISSVQKAVRSHQNLYGDRSGTPTMSEVFGSGKLLEAYPTCPTGGTYAPTYADATTLTYPAIGTAYLTCNATDHAPANTDGW